MIDPSMIATVVLVAYAAFLATSNLLALAVYLPPNVMAVLGAYFVHTTLLHIPEDLGMISVYLIIAWTLAYHFLLKRRLAL